jgi:hypothetical protein
VSPEGATGHGQHGEYEDVKPLLQSMRVYLTARLAALALIALAGAVAVGGMVYRGGGLFTDRHLPLIRGLDDTYYFLWLPKLVIDHDLDFESALARCPTITESDYELEFTTPLTPTGLHYNKFPVGWALGSLPFYLMARGLAVVFGLGDHGWEPVYQVAVWLGQLCYALAGLIAGWRILCRFFEPAIAAAAVAAGWLASPLVFYQSAGLSTTHSQVFALFAISSWLALKIADGRTGSGWFAALGLAAGLLAVTRFTAIVYLALPAVVLVRYAIGKTPGAERAWHLLIFILGALPPLLVQCAAWKILDGSWISYSYRGEGMAWAHPHVFQVLFSPFHGFFYWHPLMALGIAAGAWWAARRNLLWAWVASFVLILLLNAAWHAWWFGVSFGNRAFEGAVLLAMAGLGSLFAGQARRPVGRWLVVAAVGFAIAWNLMLFGLFLTRRIPGEAPVTWPQAWHAFVGSRAPSAPATSGTPR